MAGESEADPTLEAHRAFEAGDFRRARRLAAALERDSSDEMARRAAQDVLERLRIDPLVVWITVGSALLFLMIVWATLG